MDSEQSQGTCLWLPRLQAPCWGPRASPASLAWRPHGLSSTASLVPSPSPLELPPPSPTLGLWRRLVGPPVQKADEAPVRGGAGWGQGTHPGGKLGSGNRGAPNWRLGDRKPSPHPASSPTAGTRPRKPRKGELGLFLFCSQPLPVSKLRAATGFTPPCPPTATPKTPILGRGRRVYRPPGSPTSILAAWPLTLAPSRSSGTHEWTLPRAPTRSGESLHAGRGRAPSPPRSQRL